jgi:hypothetical protein
MNDDQAAAAAKPDPVTCNQVGRRYGARVWEAIERRDELDRRYHGNQAEVTLKARGDWDPARFGPGGTKPLTTAEHLERIALDEHIARHYQPHYELDEALKAGATLAEVGEALGCDADQARERVRSWAEGQHHLWTDPGFHAAAPHQFGMSDDEYAAVLVRTADPEAYPGGIGDPANIGIRADREARPDDLPDAPVPEDAAADAERAAAEWRDRNGEADPFANPDSALPAAADYVRQVAANLDWLEAGKVRAADLADVGYGLDPDLSYGDAVRLRDDVNSRQQEPEAGQ